MQRFNFEELAFQTISSRIRDEDLLSWKEFYRMCGSLYSLRKEDSRRLARVLVARYGLKISKLGLEFID